MYSVNVGLLLKFDWNYVNEIKDSKGLIIFFNKEIIKMFILFICLIILLKVLCIVVIFLS